MVTARLGGDGWGDGRLGGGDGCGSAKGAGAGAAGAGAADAVAEHGHDRDIEREAEQAQQRGVDAFQLFRGQGSGRGGAIGRLGLWREGDGRVP
jgi:hypothetical protein